MNQGPTVLIEDQKVVRLRPTPRLKLLTELEPRHRVFFDNLTELLLLRKVPQVSVSSRPAPFWNDVFVSSAPSWTSFLESMIWHVLLLILFVWGQSRVWTPVKLLPQPDAAHRQITSYPPTHSFPASESRAVRPRPRTASRNLVPTGHETLHNLQQPATIKLLCR